jgi:hypothetical protein
MAYSLTTAETFRLEANGGLVGELNDRLEAADAEISRLRAAIQAHKVAMDHHGGDCDFELWAAMGE